jgi:hypothetical protein
MLDTDEVSLEFVAILTLMSQRKDHKLWTYKVQEIIFMLKRGCLWWKTKYGIFMHMCMSVIQSRFFLFATGGGGGGSHINPF